MARFTLTSLVVIFSKNFASFDAFVNECLVHDFTLIERIEAKSDARLYLNCAALVELSANTTVSFDRSLDSVGGATSSLRNVEH